MLSNEKTQDVFNKHFKSVKEFDPYNTTKMLKLVQDVVKVFQRTISEAKASTASLLPLSYHQNPHALTQENSNVSTSM